MSKVIKPAQHGILDYALAFLFLLAPSIFNFPDNAATLSYVVGVAYLGTSLITRYPLGLWKVLPFPTHGVIESIMAAAWVAAGVIESIMAAARVAAPWLFGFSAHGPARNFFVLAGVGLLLVVALTDYKSRATAAETRLGHA